jgi:hypothetical protein
VGCTGVGSHGLLEDGEKVIGERFRAGSGDGEVCGVYAVMTPTVTGQRPLKTENPFKGFA